MHQIHPSDLLTEFRKGVWVQGRGREKSTACEWKGSGRKNGDGSEGKEK